VRELPPLDTHAHVSSDISESDLERLGAVVLIATRSLADFDEVAHRKDLVSIWGVGCHPSLVGVQRAFDPDQFECAVATTAYVAEVGLDGNSRVPLEKQQETLRSVLRIVERLPRIVSLHSYKATGALLDLLSEQPVQKGRILHWWLGNDAETKRALELGCFFSVNYSMIRSSDAWQVIPLNRLLFETDHPSGDRLSASPRQPGRIRTVEVAVAKQHGISTQELRRQVWKNFAHIVSATQTRALLPEPVQRMIDSIEIDSY
jgi:TatD DNase family protein